MFGSIGPTELILIFIIALLVFGPKKLPEIGKSVGKALGELKKASEDIKGRIEDEIQASEIRDIQKDIKEGVEGFRDSITGIKDDVRRATDVSAPPSPASETKEVPPPEAEAAAEPVPAGKEPEAASENSVKEMSEHEMGEGPKISG